MTEASGHDDNRGNSRSLSIVIQVQWMAVYLIRPRNKEKLSSSSDGLSDRLWLNKRWVDLRCTHDTGLGYIRLKLHGTALGKEVGEHLQQSSALAKQQ